MRRSLIAQDLHRIGGQGASRFDAMMPVFVKCYRQPFSKPVPSVHAYFDIIQHLEGTVLKQTDKKMLLHFLAVRCTLPGMTDRPTDLAEPLQQDLWDLFLSPTDLLSPWS